MVYVLTTRIPFGWVALAVTELGALLVRRRTAVAHTLPHRRVTVRGLGFLIPMATVTITDRDPTSGTADVTTTKLVPSWPSISQLQYETKQDFLE